MRAQWWELGYRKDWGLAGCVLRLAAAERFWRVGGPGWAFHGFWTLDGQELASMGHDSTGGAARWFHAAGKG